MFEKCYKFVKPLYKLLVGIGFPKNDDVNTDAWLCATSMPEDVAWASRRDLLLCADTEEM